MDGPEHHHNKRRGIIDPNGGRGRSASFKEVLATINALVGAARVYIRVNVDPFIGRDCLDLLDIFQDFGWLEPGANVYPYLAMINAMTEHCSFIGKAKRFNNFDREFDDIQQEFYSSFSKAVGRQALEVVQYYPNRVTINCAAVSHNAVVFGPDGLMYKCGLDVGDSDRAHGMLAPQRKNPFQKNPLPEDRWDRYNPFSHERCSECQFLPICMGGCPKAQIERDEAQIAMQSAFWENNIDRVIREYYGSASQL